MRKSLALLLAATVLLLVSCLSAPSMSGPRYKRVTGYGASAPTASSKPYHIIRTNQLRAIPSGSVVGIISAAPGYNSVFMTSALEAKGLTVREINIYTLLPPTQQAMIDPQAQFAFVDSLVSEILPIVKTKAEGSKEEGVDSTNINYDALINKLYPMDDLLTEKQRADHYIQLITSLKAVIDSMKVDYLMVSGSPYTGLCYSTTIYDSKNYDSVFNNIVISDPEKWRENIPKPVINENLSYSFEDEKEPYAYWDLSYAEFVAGLLNIQ